MLPVGGCSLSQTYENIVNSNATFQIEELSFACAAFNLDNGSYEAADCQLQLVAEIDDTVTQGNVTTYGPYQYDVKSSCDKLLQNCHMTKVKLGVPAEILYFNIVESQRGNMALLLDNLVFDNVNPGC